METPQFRAPWKKLPHPSFPASALCKGKCPVHGNTSCSRAQFNRVVPAMPYTPQYIFVCDVLFFTRDNARRDKLMHFLPELLCWWCTSVQDHISPGFSMAIPLQVLALPLPSLLQPTHHVLPSAEHGAAAFPTSQLTNSSFPSWSLTSTFGFSPVLHYSIYSDFNSLGWIFASADFLAFSGYMDWWLYQQFWLRSDSKDWPSHSQSTL